MTMRIAVFINEYPPNVRSGLGRYAEMLPRFVADAHEMAVFTVNPGDLPVAEENGQLKIYRPCRRWLQRALRMGEATDSFRLTRLLLIINVFFNNIDGYLLLRRLLRRQRFDVVAVHDVVSGPAGLLCALTTRLPVVFHVHSSEFTMMNDWKKDPLGLLRVGERILAALASRIIVLTQEMFDLHAKAGWDAGRMTIIPHGFEHALLSSVDLNADEVRDEVARLRRDLDLGSEDRVFLFLGRLIPEKGAFHLVRAMARVVERDPAAKLVMLGNGMNRSLRRLIGELGLERHVHASCRFVRAEEVRYYYALADYCVFPSVYAEPFGMVALEAMSMGKPTILGHGFSAVFGGDAGAAAADGPSVLYAKADEPAELARAMLSFLSDPAAAIRMGLRARAHVRARFRWSDSVRRTLEVYKAATGTRRVASHRTVPVTRSAVR